MPLACRDAIAYVRDASLHMVVVYAFGYVPSRRDALQCVSTKHVSTTPQLSHFYIPYSAIFGRRNKSPLMLRTAILIALLFPLGLHAQQWKMEMGTGMASMQYMQYTALTDLIEGPDGAQYILTSHFPENYQKPRNQKLIQRVISRIDAQGNIHYVATLNPVPKWPMVRVYNNKFYVFDMLDTPNEKDGQNASHNTCYVYDEKWNLEQSISIPSFTQFILTDFAVTPKGSLILLNGAIGKQVYDVNIGDRGNWLTFCSPTGAIEHQEFFAGMYNGAGYRTPSKGPAHSWRQSILYHLQAISQAWRAV